MSLKKMSLDVDIRERVPTTVAPMNLGPGDNLDLTYTVSLCSAQENHIGREDFDVWLAELWKVTHEWFDALQERERALVKEKTKRQQRMSDALAGKGWEV